MPKLVINQGHGGFSLSREAFLRLRELGHQEAKDEPDIGEFYSDGSGPREEFPPIYLSRSAGRDDPLLVQVVKELGERANGKWATLGIVEVPDGVEWQIEEYDGWEHVAEKHRTWG